MTGPGAGLKGSDPTGALAGGVRRPDPRPGFFFHPTARSGAPTPDAASELATFGASDYDHADAAGFIRLFGLPVRAAAALQATRNGNHRAGDAVGALLREVAGLGV